MRTLKPLAQPASFVAVPQHVAPARARGLRLVASAHPQSDPQLAQAALSGPAWVAGLKDWVSRHEPVLIDARRTQLEIAGPLAQWMFRGLSPDPAQPHDFAVGVYPAYLLAALIAPLAGVAPGRDEAYLNSLVAHATRRPEVPWLTRAVAARLLEGLLGHSPQTHCRGSTPLPSHFDDLKFWAALGVNGKLWVSTAEWGEAGAFLLEYPHLRPGEPVADFGGASQRLMWDAHFEQFFAQEEKPLVLTWHVPATEFITPPWAHTAQREVGSMVDLLMAVQFEAVNLVPGASTSRWADSVHVSRIDPQQRRARGFGQEKSELLCHAEAWLAGLRFERLRRHDGPVGALDAAELLSFISTSVHQCAIEKRLVYLLQHVAQLRIQRASLHSQPDGDWLQGVVEDLLAARCRSASFTFGHGRPPEALAQNSNGECAVLQAWLTEVDGVMPLTQLNIHAAGPLFGQAPVTITRDFVRCEGLFPRGARVVFGEEAPLVPKGATRLVMHLAADGDAGQAVEARALSQRGFWNAVLDFGAPEAQ